MRRICFDIIGLRRMRSGSLALELTGFWLLQTFWVMGSANAKEKRPMLAGNRT